MSVTDQVDRLKAVREKIDEYSKSRERLTGELETHQKRLDDLETECRSKFDVGVDELPGLISGLEEEAEKALAEAERILGMKKDESDKENFEL